MAINEIVWPDDFQDQPYVMKPKKAETYDDVIKMIEEKYKRNYDAKQARQAKGFKYDPRKDLQPKKRGLRINSGMDANDTVCIGYEMQYRNQWRKWKLGFTPDESAEYVTFIFANGDKRKLRYQDVYDYLHEYHIGKETPFNDLYMGFPTHYYKVKFPDLEAYATARMGV